MRAKLYAIQHQVQPLADRWIDSADRYVSALHCLIRDGVRPSEVVREYILTPDFFPTETHRTLARAMMGLAVDFEIGKPADLATLRTRAEALGYVPDAGQLNENDKDLIDELGLICGSGAGLAAWICELQECRRKAAQVARLWKRLRDLSDDGGRPVAVHSKPIPSRLPSRCAAPRRRLVVTA
ncbi:MAG TPA: hypothetical protein VNT79_02185 [Phycisphaerae bacterium]|nr:hypothetical protein [Phycisphaerae bacterium]